MTKWTIPFFFYWRVKKDALFCPLWLKSIKWFDRFLWRTMAIIAQNLLIFLLCLLFHVSLLFPFLWCKLVKMNFWGKFLSSRARNLRVLLTWRCFLPQCVTRSTLRNECVVIVLILKNVRIQYFSRRGRGADPWVWRKNCYLWKCLLYGNVKKFDGGSSGADPLGSANNWTLRCNKNKWGILDALSLANVPRWQLNQFPLSSPTFDTNWT